MAGDPSALVRALGVHLPDFILLSDELPGIDAAAAAKMLKGFLDLRGTTMVLVTGDKSRLEGSTDDFNHRVFAPIDSSVLDNIVHIHKSSPKAVIGRRKQSMSYDERRIDAVVRSKVARLLKSHNQLEEYYSTRVRELEEEISHLRDSSENKDQKRS